MRSAFTLIELLVVIAIIAVLAVVVVLTLNPIQLLLQSRDSTRLSDLSTANSALSIFVTDSGGSGSLGQASTTYISIPDPSATSTAGDQCQGLNLPALGAGWTYQCSSPSNFKKVDGTGWIPVNFTKISSGAPFGTLPADPSNQAASNLYYSYTTDGQKYELTAVMESNKQRSVFNLNPSNPFFPGVYALGTSLALSGLYNASGLVGYWPMDEGGGSSTVDQSGNGNAGTWSGSSSGTNNTHYVGGKVGKYAGTFDGSSDYVDVGNGTSLGITDRLTVAAWIYSFSISSPGAQDFLSKGAYFDPGHPWGFETQFDGTLVFSIETSTVVVPAGGFYTAGNWYYVVATFDDTLPSNNMQIFVNGTFQNQTTRSTSIPSTSDSVQFSKGIANRYFNGILDDVRIYNRALSAAEIQAIYNSQR